MEVLTLFLIGLLMLLFCMLKKKTGADECFNLPPGCMGLPIIGNTLQFVFKKVAFFTEQHDEHGPVFKASLFGKQFIRVYGADNIRKIIQGDNKIVQSSYPTSVKRLVGDQSISMSHGEEHKEKKMQLMKYLNPEFCRNHTPAMAQAISERLASWCNMPEIDLFEECNKLFMELAARFLINIDISDEDIEDLSGQLKIFTDNIFSLPFNIPGFGFYKAVRAKQRMREIIASSINSSANNNKASEEFCSVLQGIVGVDAETGVEKNTVLLDSIIDLLFSGSQPVLSAGFSLVHQLSKRSDVQDKLREEIIQQDLEDSQFTVCSYDLQKMPYVSAVVRETLRLLPPVGGAYRRVIESFELDGYTIPKGWTVVFGIRETHNRDSSVSDPSCFNPDRWINSDIPNKYSFMPFGGGARACPGQAYAKLVLKLLAVELSRQCSVTITKDSELSLWPTPRPAKKITATFHRLK